MLVFRKVLRTQQMNDSFAFTPLRTRFLHYKKFCVWKFLTLLPNTSTRLLSWIHNNFSTIISLFKFNKINNRKRYEICSKLTMKIQWRHSDVIIVNSEQISGIVLASQPAFTYSKLTKETLEQGVKYVRS